MKTRLEETNYMRRLMGLNILTEEENIDSKEKQEELEFKKPIFKGISDLKYVNERLVVTINIENPSKRNIKIKNYDLDVFIDNEKIGNTKMDGDTIILKKGGEKTPVKIELDLDISSKFVIDMVKNFMTNPKKEYILKLDGTVKAGIFIFFKKIKVTEKYSFKIGDVDGLKKLYNVLDSSVKKSIDDLIDTGKKEVDNAINKGKNLLKKINIGF